MSEKKKRDTVEFLCGLIGVFAILGYILIGVGAMVGINPDLYKMRLILVVIAAIAFSIKLIVELISRDEHWIYSIISLSGSCGLIIMSAVNLL